MLQHDQLAVMIDHMSDIMNDFYRDPTSRPVTPDLSKEDAVTQFNQTEPPIQGLGVDKVFDIIKDKLMPNTVKTWHPLFLNQMTAGVSAPAVIGDLLASMINTTMATWEMTPAFTILERNVSQWMAQLIGMPEGSSGIFIPGGSMSNLLALMVARHEKLGPETGNHGLRQHGVQGVIFCSEGAHYSIANAANILGIGKDYVRKIKTNDRLEIDPEHLQAEVIACREEGLQPFVVVATMGLTVTGGFDPLAKIAEVCREENLHLHVDAAFGGGLALTKRGERLFQGIEHADTVVWDAHKWFHTPLTTTALLAPDARIFKHVFSSNADYLFHPQAQDIDMADDLGQYTPMCGKRIDALHIWMMVQIYGIQYFRDLAQSRLDLADTVHAAIFEDADLQPSYRPVTPIVCFRFAPKGSESWTAEYANKLHRHVRQTILSTQRGMFNITKLRGRDHFRMILINPLTTEAHIRELLEDAKAVAHAYLAAHPPSTTVEPVAAT